MSPEAPYLPIADHGDLLAAVPFLVPMLVIVVGLVVLVLRDRLGGDA